MNADWRPEDRDCGGLLRYALTKALMPHGAARVAKFRYLPRPKRAAADHHQFLAAPDHPLQRSTRPPCRGLCPPDQ
ncbi:hypothetical protein [Deinococcus saxicola]|uniref:hypothetical protein n=1 Tax=Deinococcus saxicola TaxID=249406 RepID=UPI0039EF49C2